MKTLIASAVTAIALLAPKLASAQTVLLVRADAPIVAPKIEHPQEATGVNLRAGLYVLGTAGDVVQGLGNATAGIGIDLSVGVNVTQHLAFDAGLLFAMQGYSECSDCRVGTRSIPTRVEYDFESRKSGPYLSLGIGWLQSANISVKGESDKSSTSIASFYSTMSPIAAFGWRLPLPEHDRSADPQYRTPSRFGLDIRLQAQRISYDEVRVEGRTSVPVAEGKQTAQMQIGLSVAGVFNQ